MRRRFGMARTSRIAAACALAALAGFAVTPAAVAQTSCDNVCNQQYALCIAASCTPSPLGTGSLGTALCTCAVETGYSVGPVGCAERAPVQGNGFTLLISTFSTALYGTNSFYNGTGVSADCYGGPCITFDGKTAYCSCKLGAQAHAYWTEAGGCTEPAQNVVYSGASSPFDGGLADLAAQIAKCSNTQVPTPAACSSASGSPKP
jgi:hypothetical protein